ncbi:MAG: T9SS type A sorting domain-containing protein, partial [Bacteroidales bacterium]|nr:T9SS type A sorting domain-containing protein [Bacteroidales bacterium]
TGNNWSNTSLLGDLQLADGPYTVNIPETGRNENVLIYPNPTSGEFFIRLEGTHLQEKFSIEVFDVSGRLIASKTPVIIGPEDVYQFSPGHTAPGIYFVHLYSDNGIFFTKKLIIK